MSARTPLPVLFCQPTARRSGSEHSLLQILRALDRTRIRPLLLLGESGPMEQSLAALADETFLIHAPKLRRAPRSAAGFALSFPRLVHRVRRIARAHGVRVLHVNTLMFPQASLAGRLARLAVVTHVREVQTTYPRPVYRGYFRFATRVSTRMIPVCEAILRQDLPEATRVRERSRVVYNASDHPLLEPRPLARAPEFVSILPTTRRKGLLDLVEAYRRLASQRPGFRFTATIVGRWSEPETHAAADALLRQAGLAERVRFAGEQAEVAPFLARADLLVHPSHTEAFPRVLVEAANCALPCVATDVGGAAEAVIEGETGLLVPPRSPQLLAEAIGKLGTDPALHGSMARAAIARYRATFTPAIMARGIEEVLAEADASRPPER